MADLSRYSDMELLSMAKVPPAKYTDAFLHHLHTAGPDIKFDKQQYSTLDFQKYDKSNKMAQGQANDAITGLKKSAVGVVIPDNEYRADAERAMVNNVAQAMTDPMIARTLKGTSSPILMNPSKQELKGFLNRTKYNEVRGIKDPATGDQYFGDANLFDHKGMSEELGIPWDSIIEADYSHRMKGGDWLLDRVGH